MRFVRFLLLTSVVAVFGCGGGPTAEESNPTVDETTQTIKSVLEKVAESGDLESAEELRSYVEEDLAGVDEAKSKSLMPDVEALEKLTDPAQIKAKAKEMLGKL